MGVLKKYKLIISLSVFLIVLSVMCGFMLMHYKGGSNSQGTGNARLSGNITVGRDSGRTNFSGNGGGQPPGENQDKSGQTSKKTDSISSATTKNQKRDQQISAKDKNADNGENVFNKDDNAQSGKGNFAGNNNTSSSMATAKKTILLYSVIFFITVLGGVILAVKRKLGVCKENKRVLLIIIFSIGLIFKIILAMLMNGHNDINLFKNWAETAAKSFTKIYSGNSSIDYPPLYLYVLALIGKIGSVSFLSKYFYLLLKLPAILGDLLSAYLIYKIAMKYSKEKLSILMPVLYIFNPAILINSSLWGQVDSVFTTFVILSIYFMIEKKLVISSVFFTLSILMKPQGIIFLPILFFEIVRERDIRNFIKAMVTAIMTIGIVILPFSLNNGVAWLYKLYTGTVNEYPYASVNAFNFFSLLGGNFKQDTLKLGLLSYHSLGLLFIILITLVCWFLYIKGRDNRLAFGIALMLIGGVFTFSTSMHERYLFPAAALSLIAYLYLKDIRLFFISMLYSITIFINTYYVLFDLSGGNSVGYNSTLIITAILNILIFIYLGIVLFDLVIRKKLVSLYK